MTGLFFMAEYEENRISSSIYKYRQNKAGFSYIIKEEVL